MKKNLFIIMLAFSLLAFPCGNSFAKKAKKYDPIKAPVVIKTEPEEKEVQENIPDINEIEVKETKEKAADVKKDAADAVQEESSEVVETADTKAEEKKEDVKTEPVVHIVPKETPKLIKGNPSNTEIEKFFVDFANLQNKHNIKALKKVYTDDFINTDGYNKTQLFALMNRTYAAYPDLKTEYLVKSISSTKHFAMANVTQKVTATTKDTSKITKDKGTYTATLETIVYLKKIGKEWQIYSEAVLSEVSKLSYGMAKDVSGIIDAPQKVLAGSDYSASVTVETPSGYSSIASVNNTQVVEGYNMSGESFRQVPSDSGTVERVLKANNLNNNEAVVVSVGFTKLTQDMFKKAKMDISGLMILMRRVDIVPENSNHKTDNKAKNEKK
ncbi:MAG: hypothetical protein K6A44_07735 [bacterium]|nr:hypothetical protein [bacterium]